mmetsp:Transcript_10274/g.33950  ORF Transcript_10274/g.33950 Transcript_10274/m.33950 type:complete len:111 (-) Transcript_10274:394-726(-)
MAPTPRPVKVVRRSRRNHKYDYGSPPQVGPDGHCRFRCLHCRALSKFTYVQCKCGVWLFARKARHQQKCRCPPPSSDTEDDHDALLDFLDWYLGSDLPPPDANATATLAT